MGKYAPLYYTWLRAEQILSAYEAQYPYSKVDACSATKQFDFWPSTIFGGCPLTFILTKDEDRSTEYIGVSPPCKLLMHATIMYLLVIQFQ